MTRSFPGDGVGEPNSDEGTGTLILYVSLRMFIIWWPYKKVETSLNVVFVIFSPYLQIMLLIDLDAVPGPGEGSNGSTVLQQ